MSEYCWTNEKDACLGDGACKYCADAAFLQCRQLADTTMITWDGTVPSCINGSSSPVGAIVGAVVAVLLIVGVWAYWVYVLNGALCRNFKLPTCAPHIVCGVCGIASYILCCVRSTF